MPESSVPSEQSGTQAFPIVVSATPAEPPAASTDLAALGDQSDAVALAKELRLAQQRVLQEMGRGSSIAEASKATGVSCRTISRWANEDPKFIAAFNAWKSEQLECGRASTLAMTGDIAGTLHSAVKQGNAGIAYRMARDMGMLKVSNPGPIDAAEIERRHRIRQAQLRDELSQAEYQHDLDLHDRAEKDGVAWARWARERLTYHEQSLLKFLRDKLAGRTTGGLFLFSKRQLSDLLREAGVPEDQALQLLCTYRRPYPGFFDPDDLPYAEDQQNAGEAVAAASDPIDSAESEPPATNA